MCSTQRFATRITQVKGMVLIVVETWHAERRLCLAHINNHLEHGETYYFQRVVKNNHLVWRKRMMLWQYWHCICEARHPLSGNVLSACHITSVSSQVAFVYGWGQPIFSPYKEFPRLGGAHKDPHSFFDVTLMGWPTIHWPKRYSCAAC